MMRATSGDERRTAGRAASGATGQEENGMSGRATSGTTTRTAGQAALEEVIRAAGIPSPDIWAGISADERAYRKRVLDDIARRVAEEGVHTAVPGDDRGRQFMPFAALKGYDDIVRDSQGPTR